MVTSVTRYFLSRFIEKLWLTCDSNKFCLKIGSFFQFFFLAVFVHWFDSIHLGKFLANFGKGGRSGLKFSSLNLVQLDGIFELYYFIQE